MSVKKTEAEQVFSQKIRVLSKLYASGYKTEKDLQSLGLVDMLKIRNITVPELTVITELQQRVRSHTLYSYLGGGAIEQQPKHENS